MKPAVATLAAADPQLRRVLDDLGIDYTSMGSLSLDDAAAAAGYPLSTVLQRLGREPLVGAGGGTWLDAALSRLIAHLCAEHTQLRFGLLRTTAAAFDEATEVLGENHSLDKARLHFAGLVVVLGRHFRFEEHLVFPLVEAMEDAWSGGPDVPPRLERGMRPVIERLIGDHREIDEHLRELRACRESLAAEEPSACRNLIGLLRDLESRLHRAMNLENTILFPRTEALEDDLYAAGAAGK